MKNSDNLLQIDSLLKIMQQLRDPKDGCPWDLEQNFASIIPYTLEEAYEVADAIERQDWQDLKDELGDLLFQVIFYSQLAKEQDLFSFNDVVNSINHKLIRRHPHVFGEKDHQGKPIAKADWEGIKAKERQQKNTLIKKQVQQSILSDIANTLPSLNRAIKIQKRCAQVGFDWQNFAPVVAKIHEEIDEVMEEALMVPQDQSRIEEEVGDLLFAVTNLARHLNCDPESALRNANNKFIKRFQLIEKKVAGTNKDLKQHSLEELEELWQQVKKEGINQG